MADRLSTDDEMERTYQFRLHAYAGKDVEGTVTLDAHGPHIVKENGALQVYTQTSFGECIHEEPPFEENASPHVHELDKDPEHHTVTDATVSGVAPDFLTVLAPYQTGMTEGAHAPLTVTPIATEKGVAWLIEGEETADVAWVREEGAPSQLETPSGETITTDGAFVFVSLDGSLGLLSRGAELKLDEAVVVSASSEEKVQVHQ
jgi:hypothetical protein